MQLVWVQKGAFLQPSQSNALYILLQILQGRAAQSHKSQEGLLLAPFILSGALPSLLISFSPILGPCCVLTYAAVPPPTASWKQARSSVGGQARQKCGPRKGCVDLSWQGSGWGRILLRFLTQPFSSSPKASWDSG